MKQKKDIRFWLTTFSEEQEQTKHEYKSFKREIENNGCFKVKTETDTVKIYTPELAVIFTSKELPSRNMDTQTETNINGWEYLKTYIEAYKEGEQYFETEFKVSPNTLYGVNAEQYVRDIHLNFFHVKHTGINEGWGYVKKQYPIILTHKAVKEFGYYSGIVNKVEEQVKKYPRLFATFDKCEHNLPPQPIDEQKPIKYGAKEYALTYIFDLYAIGQQVPINRVEGSFDAKKIKQDASKFPMYDKAPDTFYRAVKSVLEYDLNKPTDLQNISKDWLNAVRNLSTNWVITEQYLKDKNLIGE